MIRPEFRYHELNQKGVEECTKAREAFSALLGTIESLLPTSSRERALAVTKLQEACKWTVGAIALNLENHQ